MNRKNGKHKLTILQIIAMICFIITNIAFAVIILYAK